MNIVSTTGFMCRVDNGKTYYTPVTSSKIKIDEKELMLKCIKVGNRIEVYVEMDNIPQGHVFFDTMKDLQDFRESVNSVSNSPYHPIKQKVNFKDWSTEFKFREELGWKYIEESITLHTLVSLIELIIPTNWLILLK